MKHVYPFLGISKPSAQTVYMLYDASFYGVDLPMLYVHIVIYTAAKQLPKLLHVDRLVQNHHVL